MKWTMLFSVLLCAGMAAAQEPLWGRTTGPLPYLEFGPGDDRLGGAKMTYLDSNVMVKVVDSLHSDYRVQLSGQHFAWLPKMNFRPDTSLRMQPYFLTGSWRVWGDERYDYVSLHLPERLPYRSQQLLHPSRIIIDIFGAVSNTNWITQLKTAKEVANVWYDQAEDDLFRVTIELKHTQHWGHFIYYENNILHIRVKRQPSLKLKDLRIAVDAGHGGANTGARGVNSRMLEKDLTLKMALELEKNLKKKGARVFMTRTHDTDINMIDRTLLLRAEDPDILISIHLNSSGNPAIRGASTYYRYIGFRPLSTAILDRLLQLGLSNFGNVGAFNFALSGPTEYPNCLVEVAFLSNEADEWRIMKKKFNRDLADKISKGIQDWLSSLR